MSMLIGILLSLRIAILSVLCYTLIVGYLSGGSLELSVYAAAGALIGSFALGRGERISSFVRAGLFVATTNLVVLLAFRLPGPWPDARSMAQLAGAALGNGALAASIAPLGFYVLGSLFGITTPLQLMDLSRPNHPLLRGLLLKAPGTYHHSILVANMAERAAAAVSADAFLARVGAYYHDIGKTVRPYFFVENRSDQNPSPHERLDPHTSAQIIISHVADGLELARRYRLPMRIRDFIPEHHGTTLVSFFYYQARQNDPDGSINENDFRYPGPRPRSRETAIVMLADGCESAVRSANPKSPEEIDELVQKVITRRMLEGELDHCNLTLQDLHHIRQVFVRVLRGVHHPRIRYPAEALQTAETPEVSLEPGASAAEGDGQVHTTTRPGAD